VSEKYRLQGGYLDVYRGNATWDGWNSIMGSFMTSKSANNVRVVKNVMRCDDATNLHGRRRQINFERKYPKVKFIRKVCPQTEEHKFNI
jgi:hypothetical protein